MSEDNPVTPLTDSNQENTQEKTAKTKIVVHINNYILSKTPSDDGFPSHLRLSTPENTIDQLMLTNRKISPKIKKVMPPKNNYIILHAKSIKFPVKITSSYEIYPTTNVNDDKYDKYDKYDRSERKNRYINNAYNSNRYETKFDINFKLPTISSHQNNLIKNNLTYPKLTLPKMTLPNYLKAQYNLQPTNAINYKPATTNTHPSSNQPNMKIAKLKESSYNSAPNVNTYTRLETKEMKESNTMKRPKIIIPTTTHLQKINRSLVNSNESFINDFNDASLNSNLDGSGTNNKYINPNSTFIDQTQYGFQKLPNLQRTTYDAVECYNPEISSSLQEETSRLYNLSDHIDDEINKIIRNYPSIVVRRRGVQGETKKRQRKNLPKYLTENQISYQKASPIEQNEVVAKPRRDLAHTIDYGKLI